MPERILGSEIENLVHQADQSVWFILKRYPALQREIEDLKQNAYLAVLEALSIDPEINERELFWRCVNSLSYGVFLCGKPPRAAARNQSPHNAILVHELITLAKV